MAQSVTSEVAEFDSFFDAARYALASSGLLFGNALEISAVPKAMRLPQREEKYAI